MSFHIRIRLIFIALIGITLLPAAQATAQEIHTCIDAKGSRSYQNLPCDAGQRTASVRSYEVKPDNPALAARTLAIQQEMDRRNRPSAKAAVIRTANRRASGPTPCQAAKVKREAILKRVGLKRNFDLLSRLDSEVWDVCKGF